MVLLAPIPDDSIQQVPRARTIPHYPVQHRTTPHNPTPLRILPHTIPHNTAPFRTIKYTPARCTGPAALSAADLTARPMPPLRLTRLG